MKITNKILTPIIVLFFVAGIAGTMVFNIWKTESTKEPVKIKEGEFAGMNNPDDIRGSYTFEDINKAFDVDVEILGKAFGVKDSKNLNEFQVKELEEIYGAVEGGEIGTGSVRLFVALFKKLPYTLDEESLLPSSAVAVLKDVISEEEYLKLKETSVDLSNVSKDSNTSEHTENVDDKSIKGKTTFNEVLQWGLSREDVEKVLGKPMGKTGETIRDFCTANGIEFSEAKTALQLIIDSK